MPDFQNAKLVDGKWVCWDFDNNCFVEVIVKKLDSSKLTYKFYRAYFSPEPKKGKDKEGK